MAPGEFTATRNVRAADARKQGDRQLAEAISALRKPTVGAWAVNRLARRRAHELRRFLDLGPALRAAQEELAGDAIRALSRKRQETVRALVEEACALAEEAGQRLNDAGRVEVERVLEQALAEPVLADAVRGGRLTTAPPAAGGTGFGLEALPASGTSRDRRPHRQAAPPDETPVRQRELTEAKRRAHDARRNRERAEKALARVRARVAQAEQRLDALRAEERAAADQLGEARKAEREAQHDEKRAEAATRRSRT